MCRKLFVSVMVLFTASLGALAIEWKEIDWGTEVVLDSSTGLPAIVFYVGIQYSEFPTSMTFEGDWEAYEIVNGQRISLRITPTSSFIRATQPRIYTSTSQIPIEPGKQYGATVVLRDAANNLSYERTFTYGGGDASLPYGIALSGWNGSDDVDLSRLPDEELEELAILHDELKRFTQSPDVQLVASFLRGDAAARPDTAILLNDAVGEGEEINRCTYTACGAGCCSTCIEHEEDDADQEAEEAEEPAPDVRIECIVYEGAHFEDDGNEYVQIKNFGELEQDLLGWTLYNQSKRQHAFTFPESFMLEPGMSIRIYTNEAYAKEGDFSFGLEESLWTNVIQYPLSLVLIPVPSGISAPAGAPFTFTVNLTLYTYTLASQDDINAILNELSQFDQEFNGSVYAGSMSSFLGDSKTIFVHDLAWRVLEAASREIGNR